MSPMASSVEDLKQQYQDWQNRIGAAQYIVGNLSSDPGTALKTLRVVKAQLEAIGPGINSQIQAVRALGRAASDRATYRPGLGGALLGASYRQSQEGAAARQKDQIETAEDALVTSLVRMRADVDAMLARLDLATLEAERKLAQC
jgi:hypothetical protein